MSTKSNRAIFCVLTGGPCGGKTSSLNHMRSKLTELGYAVFTIPELPTLLMTNGALYPGSDENRREQLLQYEANVLKFQLDTENTFASMATIENSKSVVICDRGALDVAAYVPKDLFEEALQRVKSNTAKLLERYDLVCHLVTTADGAEEFYSSATNAARLENAEQARHLDMVTRNCWSDHPRHFIIHNDDGGFQAKLEKATNHVLNYVKSIHDNV